MDTHDWLIFLATLLGVSLIPGPSTLIAFTHGATHGSGRAAFTALGNTAASTLQALAASAGLGMIVTRSATLFLAVKYAGAFYLIYVGIQFWRGAARGIALETQPAMPKATPRKLFTRGFMVAASNPKAVVFFTALFPQFLSAQGTGVEHLAGMVLLVGVCAFSVAAFYGCLGAWLRGLKLSKTVMTRFYKMTGGLFVASGVGLVASGNP